MLPASRKGRCAQGFALSIMIALAGCQGLAVPRPFPNFRAGTELDAKTGTVAPAPVVEDTLPPLPESAQAAEASLAQPTPLLDAALARAQADKEAILSDVNGIALSTGMVATTADPEAPSDRESSSVPAVAATPSGTPRPSSAGQDSEIPVEPPRHTDPVNLAESPSNSRQSQEQVVAPWAQLKAKLQPPSTSRSHSEGEVRANDAAAGPSGSAAATEAQAGPARDQSEPACSSINQGTTARPAQAAAEVSRESDNADRAPALAAPSDTVAFEIADLRLCRKVIGFGNYEALDSATCKPGQAIILYCEMAGVSYEGDEGRFHSRLSARIELLPAAGGEPVWTSPLGVADDTCVHPRRDYYVNYRLSLPDNLPPGLYLLRLSQTDTIAHRKASKSLDVSLRP